MCGALSEKLDSEVELDFAVGLLNEVVRGLPMERLGLHVCRGNWTRDESQPPSPAATCRWWTSSSESTWACSSWSSAPRAPASRACCGTSRTTCASASASSTRSSTPWSPSRRFAGVSLVAVDLFGQERVLLTPDCGFATFADNPVASANTAEAKLKAIVDAREMFGTG